MRNEDTGDEIKCPRCGSDDDCPHLLAVIDSSFLECSGGYAYSRFGEFSTAVEKAFLRILQSRSASKAKWKDRDIQELWASAKEGYEKSGEVWLDCDVLFRIIITLLEEAGGEQYYGPIDEEGGPGYSSAITLFHAKNPKKVFDGALSDLKAMLGNLTKGNS